MFILKKYHIALTLRLTVPWQLGLFSLLFKLRFSWKLREIRWPTFHIRRSSFVTLFCTIKHECGVAGEGLHDGSENTELVNDHPIGWKPIKEILESRIIWNTSTWRPACPSSTALRADFSTRMAVGLFLRISLHHLIVSCSSWSSWSRSKKQSLKFDGLNILIWKFFRTVVLIRCLVVN